MRPASSNSVKQLSQVVKRLKPIDQRRRQTIPLPLQVLLLAYPLLTNGSYLCSFPADDTWQSLLELLNESSDGGFVVLCPFSIQGEGCPASDEVGYVVTSNMYIMCEPSYGTAPSQLYGMGDKSCSIDCPGTHFVVQENGSLTLDSIILRGSKSSAIQVQSNASLTVFSSHFENNNNPNSNGGAISANQFSDVYLSQASFINNSAASGGGLFILGSRLHVQNCEFVSNVATSRQVDTGGGAIYMGSSSSTTYLTNSKFDSNTAVSFGPAILDMTHKGDYIAQANTGCNNVAQSFEMACNGVLQVVEGVDICFPFESICQVETPSQGQSYPSLSPASLAPTVEIGTTALPTSLQLLPSDVPSFQHTTELNSSAPTIIMSEPPSEEQSIVSSTSIITFSPTGSPSLSNTHTEPMQPSAAVASLGRPFQDHHTNEPTAGVSTTSSEADSGTFFGSFESTTSAITEQRLNVETIQTDILHSQKGSTDSLTPTILESGPLPEAAEMTRSNSEAVKNQLNEVTPAVASCVRLAEIDMLSSQDSYLQATLSDDPFELTGLGSCESVASDVTKGKIHRLVGSGAVMTAHTCSFFSGSSRFDTQLSIYTIDIVAENFCAEDLTCVTANDDFCGRQSLVSWLAEEGRVYFIYVQGKSSPGNHVQQQQFSLTVAPTPGGSCQSAISIKPNPFTGELELPVVEDPSGRDQRDMFGFVWFTVAQTDYSWLIASACREDHTFPSYMRVFQGSCDADWGLQQVETIETPCLFGQILTWLSAPEERYYIKATNL